MVVARNEVDGALALDLLVQRGIGDAVDGRRVAQLLVERSLVVETCSQSHGDILIPRGDDAERHAG